MDIAPHKYLIITPGNYLEKSGQVLYIQNFGPCKDLKLKVVVELWNEINSGYQHIVDNRCNKHGEI